MTAPLLAAQLTALLLATSQLTACGVRTRGPAMAKQAQAPDFELPDQRGRRVALSQLAAGDGRAVLVFYRGHW
jgi:cytochrome oxidase Cu insertion factor (SCO1/SenC/PrrC family)